MLVRFRLYTVAGVPVLIYTVKFDDGKVLKLPEDCLYEHKGKIYWDISADPPAADQRERQIGPNEY